MATPVTMPMLGLTMEEGTVAQWLKGEGEAVRKDEPLLTVEIDKGTVEVPAPASGVLRRIVVQPGQTVPIKTLIAEIAAPGEAGEGAPAGPASVLQQTAPAGVAPAPAVPPDTGAPPSPAQVAAATVASAPPAATVAPTPDTRYPAPETRLFASPRARGRAGALGIELALVQGTGPRGRIVEEDVLAFAQAAPAQPVGQSLTARLGAGGAHLPSALGSQRVAPGAEPSRVPATPLARRMALEHGVALSAVQGTGPGGRVTHEDVLRAAEARLAGTGAEAGATAPAPAPETLHPVPVEPLSRLRRITAERMAASARSVARVTLFLEADLTEAARFRRQLAPELARLGVAKLPWDALFAKAAGLALAEHPGVNAQWVDGQGLRRLATVNVGVAVALEPEGLVVPVLRQADTRSLRELAADVLALADRARHNRLRPGEMQGATFTITNLGQYRVDGFTPIVNPPETAILGVGRIADKPAVVDGQLQVRTQCTLSLSFDHRVVDGAPAAAFLARLAELLERPYALLGL